MLSKVVQAFEDETHETILKKLFKLMIYSLVEQYLSFIKIKQLLMNLDLFEIGKICLIMKIH